MRIIYKIAAYLLVLLGIIHLALTPVFFKQFGIDVLWFAGMGMGIIFLGNLNLLVLLARRTAFYLMAITSNIMALLLMGLILSMNPAMQAYIGLGLLLLITVTSIWEYIKLLKEAIRMSQNSSNSQPPENEHTPGNTSNPRLKRQNSNDNPLPDNEPSENQYRKP